MKNLDLKIILYSVLAGICLVFFDALVDWIFFFDGTYLDSLILDIPDMEKYTRIIYLMVFLLFGIVMSFQLSKRKKNEKKIIEHAKQLEVYAKSSRLFNETLDRSVVMRRLVESALELTGATDGAAGFYEDNKVQFKEYNDNGNIYPISYEFEEGYGVPGHVLKTKKPYISHDALHDPHVVPEIQQALGFLTLVDVPIINPGGEFIGCLEVHKKKENDYFNNLDIDLLLGLASNAAVAMENAQTLNKVKIAERNTKESEERFKQLASNMKEVFWLEELPAHKLIYISKSFEDIWQRTCEEFYENPSIWMEMIHEKDKARVEKAFHTLPETGEYDEEFRIIRQDGSMRWIHDRGFSISDETGTVIRLGGIAEDITERKKVEAALYESEERFRLMMQQSPSVIELYNEEGLQIEVNEAYEKLWDFPASTSVNIFNVLKSEEVERKGLMSYVKRAYAGEAIQIPEYEFDPSGETEAGGPGRKRWLSTRIYPLKDTDGNVKNMVITHEDVSERRYAEAERLELHFKMQRLKSMELLGMLASGVAHDLNNVLSPMVGYPDLLLMDVPADSSLREPIEEIRKSGEKAAAIVQDLLTFARRGVSVNEVINLNDIVNEYLKGPELKHLKDYYPGVEITIKPETDLMNILGSPIHLSKAFMNLVSNAFESGKENVNVEISTSNKYLDRPVQGYDTIEEGEYVVLSVSDNGAGIDKEDVEKIFEPFFTKKKMGKSGTGLGMSIVYGTVVDHKGYINVESTPGKGTVFTLYFPITRQLMEKEAALLTPEDYMGNGEMVLVIDDNEQQRNLTDSLLTTLNYTVHTVPGGVEAIEYLKEYSADSLVLDMIMDPGIDGLNTYTEILKLHPGQKAVIASGFSESDRVLETQKLGAGVYIKKPFVREILAKAIKDELNRA